MRSTRCPSINDYHNTIQSHYNNLGYITKWKKKKQLITHYPDVLVRLADGFIQLSFIPPPLF